ncbi:MAG: hypothetical protein ACRD2F_02610 [Terriglobales bacterium]
MTQEFGFNSVVEFGGTQFQVQTEPCRRGEDGALAIETTVFRGGQVHYSRRVPCPSADAESVRELVRQQHGSVMAELRAGRLPSAGQAGN